MSNKLNTMKLKTKEELPFKYFVVKRDNSQDWKDYIKWLSKGYIDFWTGNHYDYYGFDGGKYQCGINAFDKIEYFINNPKLFTAREFMDILRGNESMLLEPNTYAKFQSSYRVKALFNKETQNFTPLLIRTDKNYPNSLRTVERTLFNAHENITLEEFN